MSGHNKWSKIKHKKAASDAQKSKIFGKLAKAIQVEARRAGGNVNDPGLRAVIEKARSVNMPSDNVDRAIKKASESADNLIAQLYEGYGPGGVGIIVTTLTDNTNRTSQEMRHIFSKNGGSLGTPGSVVWNFQKNLESGEWEPQSTIAISDEVGEQLERILEILDENDDVQDVSTNAESTDTDE